MKVKINSILRLKGKTRFRSDSLIVMINKRLNNSVGDVAVVEDDKEQVVSITLIETILLRLTENTSKWNRSTKLAKKSQNRGRSLLLNWRKK